MKNICKLIVIFGILIVCLLNKKISHLESKRNFETVIQKAPQLENSDDFLLKNNPEKNKIFTAKNKVQLSSINHEPLIKKAISLEEKGIFRFATSRNVNIKPTTHGTWTHKNNNSNWKFEVRSEGAKSINLAFEEFNLPEGASLSLVKVERGSRPVKFTSKDNENHGQLWSPLFKTEELIIELSTPTHLLAQTKLHLTKINHGFRDAGSSFKISSNTSGSCQIDVICTTADNSDYGPIIDIYRDQIQSVGAFTLNGIDTCSGALINNTNNDLRPLFLTAEHCGISPSNAASMVVYWNYENSRCREVGSSINGRVGDGPTTQFNTGAILRAEYGPTDFALVELDDPVPNEYSPFFAGWDRSPENPQFTIGIHHPGISEKRISIDSNPTTITDYLEATQDNNARYLRVGEWNFGTTEGGSSGSPLFDDKGNIVGQLTGGYSECGVAQGPDYYGRLHKSWTGGGTPETRLSDWLDPSGSGTVSMSGVYSNELIIISDASIIEGDAGNSILEVELRISEVSDGPIAVRVRSEDGTATIANNDYVSIDQIVTFSPGQTLKKVGIEIIGDNEVEENEYLTLNLSDAKKSRASSRPATINILNDDFMKPSITSALEFKASTNRTLYYQIEAQYTPTSFSISEAPEGMQINEKNGELSWLPPSTGNFTVNIAAINPEGTDIKELVIIVEPDSLSNAVDIENLPLIVTNKSPGWSRQINTSHDGSDAARSEPIENNENARFQIEVEGPELIYFWWKVSSEEDYDFLSIAVNGEEQKRISGEIPWQQSTIEIPEGKHNIAWSYSKDISGTGGLDTAWVDQISLASKSTLPTITSALDLIVIREKEFNYDIKSIDNSSSFSVSALPEGLEFDGNETISGRPLNSGTYEVLLTANNGNQFTASLIIRVLEPIDDAIQGPNPIQNKFNFSGSGDQFWIPQGQISNDGISAAQSGAIRDYGESSISLTINGPGTASFFWKVSSETGYDFLSFSIDGTTEERISGEVDWNEKTFFIPEGEHLLSWNYKKDEGFSEGEDKGWLDNFQFTKKATPIINVENNFSFYLGEPIEIPLSIENISTPIIFENLPDWLSYNQQLGLLTGNSPTQGNFEFNIVAINGDETIKKPVQFGVIWPISEALDNLDWEAAGNAIWFPQSIINFDQSSAAQSGEISNRQNSTIKLNVTGPASVSFWWKVSSEIDYDYLSVFLDDQILQHRISGEVDWENRNVEIPEGSHSLSWTYSKDIALSEGQDAGWLDKVEILYTGSPEITINKEFNFTLGDEIKIPFSVSNNPNSIGADNLPEWLTIDQNQAVIAGNAPEEGTYNFSIWAENSLNRVSQDVALFIIKPLNEESNSLNWEFAGNANWFSQENYTHDQKSAAQSGQISDDQYSSLWTNVIGPGSLSFWWKVSSEKDYDFLSVRLDGEYIDYISGDIDWQNKVIQIPNGNHLLEFIYTKDVSESAGLDAGWIDEITYIRDEILNSSLEIISASLDSIRIKFSIDSSFSRARIVKSYDGIIWTPTMSLSNGNSEWVNKPAEGWGIMNEVSVLLNNLEKPTLLIRLETEK